MDLTILDTIFIVPFYKTVILELFDGDLCSFAAIKCHGEFFLGGRTLWTADTNDLAASVVVVIFTADKME